MKKSKRYNTAHFIEDQYEPGSNNQVLKNKLGITNPDEMDDIEVIALKEATDNMVRKFDKHHRFTAADICGFHKIWLDGIYEWAGKYRQVNVSKGDFPFASAISLSALPLPWAIHIPPHAVMIGSRAVTIPLAGTEYEISFFTFW